MPCSSKKRISIEALAGRRHLRPHSRTAPDRSARQSLESSDRESRRRRVGDNFQTQTGLTKGGGLLACFTEIEGICPPSIPAVLFQPAIFHAQNRGRTNTRPSTQESSRERIFTGHCLAGFESFNNSSLMSPNQHAALRSICYANSHKVETE